MQSLSASDTSMRLSTSISGNTTTASVKHRIGVKLPLASITGKTLPLPESDTSSASPSTTDKCQSASSSKYLSLRRPPAAFNLNAKLCNTIKRGHWLTDKHIEAANQLLQNQFPESVGLYNPLLGQNMSFPITRDPFIQILNDRGKHWVTVAGVSASLVHVYDSVYDEVSDNLMMQIASILHSSESSITLKIHKI